MTTPRMADAETAELAQAALRWHGWGSPVGVGIFIVSLSLAGLLAAEAVGALTADAARGAHAGLQLPDSRR